MRTGPDGLHDPVLIGLGQHENAGPGRAHVTGHIQAVASRAEPQVDQHDVGVELVGQLTCRPGVRGLGHHHRPPVALEARPDAVAGDRMVLHHQDLDRNFGPGGPSSPGMISSTSVLRPGRLRMRTWPASRSTLARTDIRSPSRSGVSAEMNPTPSSRTLTDTCPAPLQHGEPHLVRTGVIFHVGE